MLRFLYTFQPDTVSRTVARASLVSILPYFRSQSILSVGPTNNHLVPDVSSPFSKCAGSTRVSASLFMDTAAAKSVSLTYNLRFLRLCPTFRLHCGGLGR